jgi:hypothetical protein
MICEHTAIFERPEGRKRKQKEKGTKREAYLKKKTVKFFF